jgi:subtilisin family serine protease
MKVLTVSILALSLSATLAFAGEKKADEVGKPRAATVLYSLKADAGNDAKAALAALLKKHQFQGVRKLLKGKVQQAKAGAKNLPAVEDLCREIAATGAVDFAEPDYLVAPVGTVPNDPGYGQQWHHVKINSPVAWDSTSGSSEVIVAVLDTGVQADHPDLAGNLMLPGKNTVDDSADTSPIAPHGTMTAGCVGAVGNNATGVSGMAWTVKILPVRVSNLTSGSAYISDMAEGIVWAADQGARVANLSYGGADSYTIDSAAQYLRGKGGLLFMAAGNDGKNQRRYPDFASFVAVGATDSTDTKTSWSTYGTFVDVVAPGAGIVTTTTGSAYAAVDGTSFSSPITAGIAALIYSVDPEFTPAQVEGFIFSTCKDLGTAGDDTVYGRGRVDAGAAVTAAVASKLPPDNLAPVADILASPTSGTAPLVVSLDGSGSSDADGTIVSHAWDFGDGTTGTGAVVMHEFSSVGNYTVRLTVTDDDGATGQATVLIKVGRPTGKPPKK